MNNTVRINKALFRLAWLYGMVVALRNYLFDRGVFRSESFPVPVISIGNITVGGTGKTPHTEYLIRLLGEKYRIAVLSRGYKRKTRGFVLADNHASAETLGDEPFQMFRKFPNATVAVDANRRRGINHLLAFPDGQRPEIILLDDAFQHRWVKPSLSVLLSDFQRPFYDDYLLPAGRLREPAKNSVRADLFIYTKWDFSLSELRGEKQKITYPSPNPFPQERGAEIDPDKVFVTFYKYKGLLPVFPAVNSTKKEDFERLQQEAYSFLLVTGLANPSDLIGYLKPFTNHLLTIIFPDHHNFSRKNIVKIEKSFQSIKNSRKILITSEKDAMRLMNHPAIPEEMKKFMFYLPVEVVFHAGQEELFTQKIEDHVKNFARNRILA